MRARISVKTLMTAGLFAMASPATACDIALLLAVDVSGSVDPGEYRIQMDGLAAGLRDDVVVEALVRGESAVALMQWTGSGRQSVDVEWTKITNFAEAEALADAVAQAPRSWDRYSTAIGDALLKAEEVFAQAPACRRKVVDVSGDGVSNEGVEPQIGRAMLARQGIDVNALVIETDDIDLTGYFWENVITGHGAFVVTANGFEEYPERMRQKLIREVAQQVSQLRAVP